jgi:hypothetical protein
MTRFPDSHFAWPCSERERARLEDAFRTDRAPAVRTRKVDGLERCPDEAPLKQARAV